MWSQEGKEEVAAKKAHGGEEGGTHKREQGQEVERQQVQTKQRQGGGEE